MKRDLVFIILLILTLTITGCHAMETFKDKNLDLINRELPDKWFMTIQENKLIFKCDKEIWVLMENRINAPINRETAEEREARIKQYGKKHTPQIVYRLENKWDKEKIEFVNKKNDNIWDQIDKLPDKYKIRELYNKFARSKRPAAFTGNTEDEKARVKLYEEEKKKLEATLIKLPEYRSVKYSLFFESSIGMEDSFHIVAPHDISTETWGVKELVQNNLETVE